MFTHVAFVLPVLFLFLLGLISPWLCLIPGVGLFLTISTALKSAFSADLQREFDSLWSRLTIFFLILKQGIGRSSERMVRSGGVQKPFGFIAGVINAIRYLRKPQLKNSLVVKFWNELGVGRTELLKALQNRGFISDENGSVDFHLRNGIFFRTDLVTATEYHERSDQLTRAKITFHLKFKTFLAGLIIVLLIGDYFSNPWWVPAGYLGLVLAEWFFTGLRLTHMIGAAGRTAGLDLLKE